MVTAAAAAETAATTTAAVMATVPNQGLATGPTSLIQREKADIAQITFKSYPAPTGLRGVPLRPAAACGKHIIRI
jgi:hypothetical protein